ncbi:MAG TPA: hypothetical protein VF572_02160 [Candidatus Saccharimonadales bacterium]|jgi:hypothetical protein
MDPKLHDFIDEILRIQPGMAGVGSAASGILGTTGTEGVAGERLRADALDFAREYSRPQPQREGLIRAAQALEGSLQTVKMVSGVSDAKLDKLVGTLHSFLT